MSDLRTLLARARAASKSGDLEAAERILADTVARAPQDAPAHFALARTRWALGRGAAFADDFRAAVARAPDAASLRFACADLLRRAGQLADAEAMLREGVARAPEDAGLIAALGVVLDEAERPAEAVTLLTRATALAPANALMRQYLAHALLRAGDAPVALKLIAELRRAKPLDQGLLALETLALRVLRDPRYDALCDYNRLVRTYDLEPPAGYANSEAFNAALADALRALHQDRAHPLDQSLRGGSQTEASLLQADDPVIRGFLAALDASIRAYIATLGAAAPLVARRSGGYRIAGCWSVRLRPGGYHVNHVHPEGWISSAYYVALPEGIAAREDQAGWLKFGEPRFPIPGCGIEKTIAPRVGLLALFPSYFWHGTIPFRDGAERLTAAFDVAPT